MRWGPHFFDLPAGGASQDKGAGFRSPLLTPPFNNKKKPVLLPMVFNFVLHFVINHGLPSTHTQWQCWYNYAIKSSVLYVHYMDHQTRVAKR